jgi:hypothetical protein
MTSCFGSGSKTDPSKEQEIITENGQDYVKVLNPLFGVMRGEKEYVYVPKSQYQPLLGERVMNEDVRIKTKYLERKIAKLERQLKSPGALPGGGGANIIVPANRVIKKKIGLLPMKDQTGALIGEKKKTFVEALFSSLFKTGQGEFESESLLKPFFDKNGISSDALNGNALARTGAVLGIQGFVGITVNRLEIIHQITAGKESYSAAMELEISLYDGLSGLRLLQSKIALSSDEIAPSATPAEAEENVLRKGASRAISTILVTLNKIEWFTHIVKIDGKRIFIQGGRDSGLIAGDLLNVYDKPGKEIYNELTGEFIGREPGHFKGRLQILDFFGVNAAITRPVLGEKFKYGNLVKLAR